MSFRILLAIVKEQTSHVMLVEQSGVKSKQRDKNPGNSSYWCLPYDSLFLFSLFATFSQQMIAYKIPSKQSTENRFAIFRCDAYELLLSDELLVSFLFF